MEEPWRALIREAEEPLADHLVLERVTAAADGSEITVSLTSDVLVEEAPFLSLQRAFRKQFAPIRVHLTIRSPQLGESFLSDPQQYAAFLNRCVARNHPAFLPYLDEGHYACRDGALTLFVKDPMAPKLLSESQVDTYLQALVKSVFGQEVRVAFRSEERIAEEMEEIRKRREAEENRAMEELLRTQRERETKATASARPKPILGRTIAQPPTAISELTEESGRVVVIGEVLKSEARESKQKDMQILTFAITDYTDTVKCKAFLRYKPRGRTPGRDDGNHTPATEDEIRAVESIIREIKPGAYLAVRGDVKPDSFERGISISLTDIERREKEKRTDQAQKKRIELHMHTNMSEMDGISSAAKLIGRAAEWGHPAVAITDHGVVQAFPDAYGAARAKGIKLIPGMEGYLTDVTSVTARADSRSLSEDMVVVDFETTGLNPRKNRVIEIGAVRIRGGQVVEEYSRFVNPGEPIPPEITKLTGISDAMVKDAGSAEEEIPKLIGFIGDAPFAAHNAKFDYAMLKSECARLGIQREWLVLDTLELARRLYPSLGSYKLGKVCKMLGISLKGAHRAVNDARATALMLIRMFGELASKGILRMDQINSSLASGAIGESWHIILLAATQDGMTNLNHIVSEGHLHYFSRRPHTPRSILQKYRKGLIVGSACAAGELFQAILDGKSDTELRRIARFYDYLEIQPIGNNAFLIREGMARDEEQLREINRRIVKLGEELGIPVCATGDVHFLDPKDAKFRTIIQCMQGYKDADEQPPLYFKTTDEMLEEFAYLGKEKAEQVVIDNPALIASRIGEVNLYPKHPENKTTFQPYWPEAADDIRRLCDEKIRELYGEHPHEIVVARKEKELKSILGYGYGTLYSIAQKLVEKSNRDGYLVGSRGSVGSSYVAHLVGISEVNALPPHYRCPVCKFTDFDVDKQRYKVGHDLPKRACPECDAELVRDGFDIPFEVFLGFKGDKVPDIDLNFSGVYQPKAHAYIEELFGKEYCYRAGTIGTLAEKTAFGYVKHYCEERGLTLSEAEMERLAMGCEGIKRTTGQHPAGMVVLPKEYEICQFVAIQHPANDMTSPVITTHYDFGSMHDVLVKLDVLGHDDPTMIRELMDLTGVDARGLPLTDEKVLSLFSGTAALGVTQEEIGSRTGTYGIPEFGTAFVRGMLEETRPHTMEELIRISGLSHGTDVWVGNAQDIIRKGIAPLSECICCRDDIMNALLTYGLEPFDSFKAMEDVRKGKGLTPKQEEEMKKHSVPAWFIDSCKKIKYMFPKGHAVAYVTMALRIAWYKVYRPAAYYCAYYTVRADGFDASLLGGSVETVRANYAALQAKRRDDPRNFTDKDDKMMVIMEIVIEMLCRGIRLLPVDLEKSDATDFQLVSDTEIRMPFRAILGLGKAVAQSIVEARERSPFISAEDLMKRTRLSETLCDYMRENGYLGSLPDSNQMTMFSGLF